ncbi:MAG: hypothetical protein ACLTDR_06010 [Adlercreutzia equolifaciens]
MTAVAGVAVYAALCPSLCRGGAALGVIRFLGQHKGAVALVMLLLLLKAGCELAIPVLTSQIVDVGIAQSGVEDLDVSCGLQGGRRRSVPHSDGLSPAHRRPHAARRRRLHGARMWPPASCRPAPAPRSAATCAGACSRGWWPSPMPRSTSSRRPRSSRAAPTMSPSSRTCAPW